MSTTISTVRESITSLDPPKLRRSDFGIYAPDEFLQLFHYERIRSDRSGDELSLVLFSSETFSSSRTVRRLINQLKLQVRVLDHIGWIDYATIGILLPMTARFYPGYSET